VKTCDVGGYCQHVVSTADFHGKNETTFTDVSVLGQRDVIYHRHFSFRRAFINEAGRFAQYQRSRIVHIKSTRRCRCDVLSSWFRITVVLQQVGMYTFDQYVPDIRDVFRNYRNGVFQYEMGQNLNLPKVRIDVLNFEFGTSGGYHVHNRGKLIGERFV
jgi:hypothetical protein